MTARTLLEALQRLRSDELELEVIAEHGTDAIRFSSVILRMGPPADVRPAVVVLGPGLLAYPGEELLEPFIPEFIPGQGR